MSLPPAGVEAQIPLEEIVGLRAALSQDPLDLSRRERLIDLVRSAAPPWHFPMMADEVRNAAYEHALRRAAPGRHVLDIGAGAGLLAMMAARAGAASVVTCEASLPVAEAARLVIRDNGLSEQIQVHAAASQALEVGRELVTPAEVLVTETFGSALLSEGVLASVADARRRLLAPGATVIPRRVTARAYLAGGERLEALFCGGRRAGFDLQAFDVFSPAWLNLHLDRVPHEVLSDDFAIFDFDLARGRYRPTRRELTVQATAPGACACIVQWLRLELDAETAYENRPHPGAGANGWMHVLHPLPAPRPLMRGETIRLAAAHDTTRLVVSLAPP